MRTFAFRSKRKFLWGIKGDNVLVASSRTFQTISINTRLFNNMDFVCANISKLTRTFSEISG